MPFQNHFYFFYTYGLQQDVNYSKCLIKYITATNNADQIRTILMIVIVTIKQ